MDGGRRSCAGPFLQPGCTPRLTTAFFYLFPPLLLVLSFRLLPAALLVAAAQLLLPQPARAQREVRHLSSLTAEVGTTNAGTYYQVGFSRFISDRTQFLVQMLAENGPRANAAPDTDPQAYRGYELGLGLAPRLLHIGEVVYLRLPLELRTRYERRPPVGGQPDSDGFSVGPSVALAADIYLLDRVSLRGEVRQGWQPLGSVERRLPRYFGAGLAFHLGM